MECHKIFVINRDAVIRQVVTFRQLLYVMAKAFQRCPRPTFQL